MNITVFAANPEVFLRESYIIVDSSKPFNLSEFVVEHHLDHFEFNQHRAFSTTIDNRSNLGAFLIKYLNKNSYWWGAMWWPNRGMSLSEEERTKADIEIGRYVVNRKVTNGIKGGAEFKVVTDFFHMMQGIDIWQVNIPFLTTFYKL